MLLKYRNMNWRDLSMKDKAYYIKLALDNNISDLDIIRDTYDKYAKGGKLDDTWTIQDEIKYKQWLSTLPDNLKNTDEYIYDMRGAYKADMQPMWNDEDNSYHLGSRDPKTGRIFKSPTHPTYLKALMEDAKLGYYPKTINGKTYTNTWKGNRYDDGGIVRVRPNDSPTASESSRLEDAIAAEIRADKNINHAYDIPYIKNKETTILGKTLTTNSLDSIAKYAGITHTPLEEAIALGFESNYGRQPYFNFGQKGVSDRAIGNTNYQKNYGTIPAHLYIRDYEYTKGGYNKGKPYTNIEPLRHGLEFYKKGKYNPALKVKDPNTGKTINHTQLVKKIAKQLPTDPNYMKWKNNSGIKEYTGKAQKERDKKRIHDEYKKNHPIFSSIKDLFGIEYGLGGYLNTY